MFDAETAALLRSAPAVPGLNPVDLPALLTGHYARLAAARLGGLDGVTDDAGKRWSLERIADTYELVASLQSGAEAARAPAFVAATAQQILARRQEQSVGDSTPQAVVDRDRVDPSIAACLLFLAAEQYADANEAATAVQARREGQLYEATILAEHISDLARGRLSQIVERSGRWRRQRGYRDIGEQALAALLEGLCIGIEIFTANFLRVALPEPAAGRYDSARAAFEHVLDLSGTRQELGIAGEPVVLAFAGPHHLASLLLTATDGIAHASLLSIPPPEGSDHELWHDWLRFRAQNFPYVWPNHRQAISNNFHQTAKSSVVVLPTGAGKTTVSSIKISGVLARRKKVIFLAPTHALVEQLTEDLQEMFPEDLFGSVVSSDFDLLLLEDATFQDVEVMTPERCLAMISFAPEAFVDVGLLVFDECHLLSPQSGKIRRALDGMLCVLGFNHIVPDADFLFLSAMLKNGEEVARWLAELTGRPSVAVDLLWKPSRQARGVIIYDDAELVAAKANAVRMQKAENERVGKNAAGLRARANNELEAVPYAIWGLQHNWLSENSALCVTTRMLDEAVPLAGKLERGPSVRLTPNANGVAARIAAVAASRGLKTIVFVNTKNDAVKAANDVSDILAQPVEPTDAETLRWAALDMELGGLRHSVMSGPAAAVPHNSSMLRLERDLAERMFKRASGAQVIVATPTLAQGLNLPAHFAILAGDKRADQDGGRESLEAHEILNAAARAGRAGHLANGLVLLVPEPIISFEDRSRLSTAVVRKLKSILPEDDHCVTISDPLEIVLDRLLAGGQENSDVKYTINRMAAFQEADGAAEPDQLFNLRKSFAAYRARTLQAEQLFEAKVTSLRHAVANERQGDADEALAILASQSGLSASLILRLKERLRAGVGALPVSIVDWLTWVMTWLSDDQDAREALLADTTASILAACGKPRSADVEPDDMQRLLMGVLGWVNGDPLSSIEAALGGQPESAVLTKRTCPRARALVGSVIPRGISFIAGLVAHVVEELDPFDQQENLDRQMVECLSSAVRKGYDSTSKLFFASENREILGRVQAHRLWAER